MTIYKNRLIILLICCLLSSISVSPVLAMEKQAEATLSTDSCSYNTNDGSLTKVILSIFEAQLTINGVSYTESTFIFLQPGIYPYSWTGLDGFTGSGVGSITIFSCEPKELSEVKISIGACVWTGQKNSQTSITLKIIGATVTIGGATYPESTRKGEVQEITIYLEPGVYPYTWDAIEGFQGSGSGELVIGDCTPKQTPTPSISPATGSNDNPLVYIIFGGASLLISLASLLLYKNGKPTEDLNIPH